MLWWSTRTDVKGVVIWLFKERLFVQSLKLPLIDLHGYVHFLHYASVVSMDDFFNYPTINTSDVYSIIYYI